MSSRWERPFPSGDIAAGAVQESGEIPKSVYGFQDYSPFQNRSGGKQVYISGT
jgi:hypothetical protein